MIDHAMYSSMLGTNVAGRARKMQSDVIMDATFTEDIQYQVGYFYDYFHDDEPLKYKDLHPENSTSKIPIGLKFIVKQKNTENKDQVGYHIQFKTTQTNSIDYYEDTFVRKWDAEFPVGLYVDLPDAKGIYRKWLVTERADWLGLQFPTWYILPVDFVYQWVYRDTKGNAYKYQMCGVQRSQSSYNSGVWQDYKIETIENQRKAILPMNSISETIFYNQRFVISAPIPEPVCWRITKVEDVNPKGIRRLTFAQDIWDQHKDYIEKDESGNVIGMYADWFKSDITPTTVLPDIPRDEDDHSILIPSITSLITVTGKPQFRIGGSAKTFTITFKNEEGEILPDHDPGVWSFYIGDELLQNNLFDLTLLDDGVKIKVKFLGDDSYIGKILTVKNISEEITASLDIEILPL